MTRELNTKAEALKPALKPAKKPPSLLRELASLLIKIGVIAAIAILIFTFVYGLHYNAEPGMNPAVKDGDLVLFYRWNKACTPGDLVLVSFQGQTQIRRVIAGPGDTVDITEDGLLLNGAMQREWEIYAQTHRYEEGIDFPLTLGPSEVFVLGDSRENATDSRIYGPVEKEDVQGTVITILRRRNL